MALNKQIHIYSLDTSCFYNSYEMEIHNKMSQLYVLRKQARDVIDQLEKKIKKGNIEEFIWERLDHFKSIVSVYNNMLKHEKARLVEQLEHTQLRGCIRNLRKETLSPRNIISVFESTLTRTMGLEIGKLTDKLMVVQAYYLEVIEDIVKRGFYIDNKKYIYLTSSAGQIRTKKTVFIEESEWLKYKDSITCGLSVEDINAKEGCNVNKYLAYLALSNSATDEWEEFDITKAIVVDDFETLVEGEVDFVDENNYTITRKKMSVPIPHMDGCGIMLPSANKNKSTMVRLPWVKGLLVPFPYDKFIKEQRAKTGNDSIGIIKDCKGEKHDILKEGIKYIFTKSQWKMHKYYSSWEEYVEKYQEYKCQAGKCNEEPDKDKFEDAKINYQMLQTLTDMTDDELKDISSKTVNTINKIGGDRLTMLKILGVTKANTNKNYLQQALELYPELLNDVYCKEVLKQVKKSIVNDARAGKLYIDGKYTFLVPDLYAFCEWLFLNDETPKGLLGDGEVFCKLYNGDDKLDILRSPHLYREHSVRKNIIDDEKKKWFKTCGVYTSTYDMISKILQFDVDGDKALVCRENTLVDVAEKSMQGVVPLYYDMKKAPSQQINNNTLYNGLKLAYTGGNIGIYSNDISKIWNSSNVDLDVIKLLCCENNFVIDYAKTLYKPERPKEVNKLIRGYTKAKVPHFFKYAKDKDDDKVEKLNNSVVNRLEYLIPKPILRFNAKNLGKFDYKKLMKNKRIKLDTTGQMIIDKYTELDLGKHNFADFSSSDTKSISEIYVYAHIRNELLKLNNDMEYIVDVLIEYLYKVKKSNFKVSLWSSFGDVIVKNIRNNMDEVMNKDVVLCAKCGKKIEKSSKNDGSRLYCDECKIDIRREQRKRANMSYYSRIKNKG